MSERSKINKVLASLPLQTCSIEANPVTGESGWKAPHGKLFRVTGRFSINWLESHPNWPQPQDSSDLLRAGNHMLYKRLLKKAKGDDKKALSDLLQELDLDEFNGYMPPTSFEGKWLVKSAETDRNPYEIRRSRDSDELYVKQDVDIWYERSPLVLTTKDLGPSLRDPVVFEDEDGDLRWMQAYAEVVPGHAPIELVCFAEPYPNIYTPKQRPRDKLILPVPVRGSDAFFDTLERGLGKIDLNQRLQEVRNHRMLGMPFADDPLRGFVLPSPARIALPRTPRILRADQRTESPDEDIEF